MKRIIFLVLISAFFYTTAEAQFAWGVKGGLNLTDNNLDVEPDTAMDYIIGYNAGVFFKFGEGIFGFQPEILFVGKGSKMTLEDSDFYKQYRLQYIDVPLLARAGFNLRIAELYFNMGPYVGYAIGGKIKENVFDESTGQWSEESYNYDFDEELQKKFDAGVIMGVGMRFLMVIAEVRYNYGFIKAAHKDHPYDDSVHKSLSFTIGVQF